MKQVTFEFPLSKEQELQKRERYETLKSDSRIQKWLITNKVQEHFLYEHSVKMMALLERYEICGKCLGLSQCAYLKKGYVLDLKYDGVLLEQLTPCHYQRKELQALAHRKQFVYCDLSESQLKIDLNELDLSKESNDYRFALKNVFVELNKQEKGVYLYGKPGVGKTFIVSGIVNQFAKQGKTVAFVNVVKLISELKQLFKDADAFTKRMNQLMHVSVLVLDDLGGENITKWSRDEILLPLLNERMELGLLTCFTSNYSFQDLTRQYQYASGIEEEMNALRFMERVKALSCEIFIKGNSRR